MEKFEKAFEGAHSFTFDKFRFDEPDYRMLMVQDEDEYLEHLRVQGAGLAYYTALSRQADRDYEEFERKLKFRMTEMYREGSETLSKRGQKNTVKDIEAFIQIKHEKEIQDLYDHLDQLKARRDYTYAFLEGWKQKSYQLSSMTNMITAGLLTPKTVVSEEDLQNNLNNARAILEKRKLKKSN